jgi:hypothetical protein
MDFGDYENRKNYHVKGYHTKPPVLNIEPLESDYKGKSKAKKQKPEALL